ncbi:MAG: alpha/beta hydrolase [Bdellovibrionales bacterium]
MKNKIASYKKRATGLAQAITLTLTLGTLGLFASSSFAGTLQTFTLNVTQSSTWIYEFQLRVGVQSPDGPIKGDILYLPGFSDRLDNHGPLFEAWNQKGFRVISFDYPSHGETRGDSLGLFGLRGLARLAQMVEKATREDKSRPLIVSGWSTGGLLAVRMAQSNWFAQLGRSPSGLILFAPGVSVRNIVGRWSWRYPLGEVTQDTLTHAKNPPHKGEIKPKSPGSTLTFSIPLKIESILSQYQKLPTALPTLVLVAGDKEDVYANSPAVMRWIDWQKRKGAPVFAVQFPMARHEIDNETEEYGGPLSRELAADFASAILEEQTVGASATSRP